MLFWLNVEEAGNASWVGQVRCLEHYRLGVDKSEGYVGSDIGIALFVVIIGFRLSSGSFR